MWESIIVVVIVGVALFYAGRSVVRSLRGTSKGGHCGSCEGCPFAPTCDTPPPAKIKNATQEKK